MWNKTINHVDFFLKQEDVDDIMKCRNEEWDRTVFQSYIVDNLRKRKTVYFRTCNYLMDLEDVTMFVPQDDLMKEINAFLPNYPENTFGLHIRRTDNIESIKNSPLESFCNVIEKNITEIPNSAFYLSTDDISVEQYLSEKYDSHILTRPKKYGRDSIDSMKDAVVDMWLLSKTRMIYGSYYSSFSRMASLVGKKELEIVKK